MKKKENMPDLVYLGLLGINSRNAALVYLGGSFLLAVGSIAAGFFNSNYFWGAGLLIYSLWYSYCISWVDNHSSWND